MRVPSVALPKSFVAFAYFTVSLFCSAQNIALSAPRSEHATSLANPTKAAVKLIVRTPLAFEPAPEKRGFDAAGPGYRLHLNGSDATFTLNRLRKTADGKRTDVHDQVRISLEGADLSGAAKTLKPRASYSNYFLGNNPRHWRTHVPQFERVMYTGIYPGIDLVYYGNQRQLEHDFVVHPGADPGHIVLSMDAMAPRTVNHDGDLVITASDGDLIFKKPAAYQETTKGRRAVEANYRLEKNGRVALQVGKYDRNQELVIDPVVVFSTFFGGNSDDAGDTVITTDVNGNVFLVGTTSSTNLTTTAGAYDRTCGADGQCTGGEDVYVAKFDPSGALLFSTYLGGSGDDESYWYGNGGVVVDSTGIYVIATTNSSDYPTTAGAYRTTRPATVTGDYSGAITKLDLTGSTLVYSSYFGGSTNTNPSGLAVDGSGNAIVAGGTDSIDFPVTAGAYQPTCPGACFIHSFVFEMNATGTAPVYSTYLGGIVGDVATAVSVDSSGNAYVAGYTLGTDFPTTAGAFQTTASGGGVYTSTDGGTTFGGSTSGMDPYRDIRSFAVDPTNNARVLAGGIGKVFASTNNGATWSSIATNLPANFIARHLAFNTTGSALVAADSNVIEVSADGGITWAAASVPIVTFKGVVASPVNASTFWAYTTNGNAKRLLISTDAGASWTTESTSGLPSNTPFQFLAAAGGGSPALYGATSSGVFKSVDGGTTWAQIATQSASWIGVDPVAPTTVWGVAYIANAGYELFRSTDSGGTWTLASNPPAPISLAAAPLTIPNGLYALAANLTIVKTSDGGNTWTSSSTSLPNSTHALGVNPSNTSIVYAAQRYYDSYAAKFSSAGALQYSTLLGSPGQDFAWSVQSDSTGSAVVVGNADSGFPTTAGSYSTTGSGTFITKLNASGGAVFSTILPYGFAEAGTLDSSGNVWVTGYTTDTRFPLTNPIQSALNGTGAAGPADAFVSELNSGGSSLLFSTLWGGDSNDYGYGIAVDGSNNVFVAGETTSPAFPTVNASQSAYGGGADDAWVLRLSQTATATDLSLTVSVAPGTFLSGSSAAVTLQATNNDSVNTATHVMVNVNVPTGFTVSGLPANCALLGSSVKCNVGTLAPLGSTNLSFSLSSITPGAYTINAGVSGDQQDPTPANNSAAVSLTVNAAADLQFTALTDNSPIPLSGPLNLTASVMNAGPNDATGASVVFTLPDSAYTLITNSYPGGCLQSGAVVTCSAGTLTSGTTLTATVSITPDPALTIPANNVSVFITTAAQVSSTTSDPNSSNNSATINSTVAHMADLTTTGVGPSTSVTAGSPVTFNMTVTNNGPDAANATVSATLPPGFAFVSGSYTNLYASNGNCTFASNVITCPVGSLPYSPASASISIQATAGSQLGFFSLGATASSSTSLDPVPLNNASNATAIVALTSNAQDALLFSLNSRGTIALLNTSLGQLAPEPPLFTAQPRFGPVVLPNGRIAFVPRASYISVVDLSIGSEIDRLETGPVGSPLVLSPDGATLVAVNGADSVELIDTSTYVFTNVSLNGLVGDNPGNINDIGLHAPAIVGRNAYFNASGLLNGSSTNGIPVVVLNLDTQAISTISMPTTSRGVIPPSGGAVATPFTIVATPDGHFLVIARQDGTVIYDLTTNSVAGRETTTTATRLLAAYRDSGNPNAFAYQVTGGTTPVLSAIDLRAGSPTFGTIVATATAAEPDPYFNKTTIQSDAIIVSGDGSKIFTSDTGGVITTVDVRSLLTGGGGAAVNSTTYPNQFSFLSMLGAMVDTTPVAGAPTVTSITPNSVPGGTTTLVTITGTNFAPDAIVYGGGDRVDPSEIVSVTPTQIQLQVKTGPKDPIGTFDVGVTNPNLGSSNQQNISAVVRNGFTILPAAGFSVNDAIAAALGSSAVASVAPNMAPTEPPSPPFRIVRASIAMTSDGNYAFVPIGSEGIDVVTLATGTHNLHTVANTGSASRLIRSIDPNTSAPVVYFTEGTTLFELDANPASGTFGNEISSIASGVPATISNANSIAASPSGQFVYVAENTTGLTPDQQVLIYDVQAGMRTASLALSNVGASVNQTSMLVTPDGKYLVLQMANSSQIGLFNLTNPTAPVLTNTVQGNIPSGYAGVNLMNYLVRGDRLYAIGNLFNSFGFVHPVLEVFRYDPAANNFSWLANYIDDHLTPGPMRASSDGTRIYVSNNVVNEVDVLDLAKVEAGAGQAIIGALSAPFGPLAIDVSSSPQAPTYGLTLTMTHTPEPVARTGEVTFVLTATNTGSADLTNTIITDTLPSGTTFVKTNPNCTLGSGTIACILNTIPGGQSVTTSITLLAPAAITGFTNTATVLATEVPSGATASNTVNIGNGADVSVNALASPSATTPGGTVTFTTAVTNNGPDNSGATVNETLPTGFAFVSATYNNPSSGSGSCTVAGQVVTCDVGSLPYSGSPTSATITLTATAGTQLGLFSLGVQAVPQNNEVNPLNNTAAAAVIVAASANAQDAYIIDDNATASIRFLQPGSLTQFASVPFVMAEPRMRPVVMPNGRLLFTGNSYIGVIDLSIGAEITRIPVPATGPYALTPDGKTLVVPSRDSVVLVDTATFQTTTIDLNGLVGDDPANTNDINLGAAVIANNKAYFNPTGVQMGSASVGLPIVVIDLASHAVSTLAFPTLSLAPNNNFENPAAAATPDGHYLVALRRDGIVIFDLATSTVALRNSAVTVNGTWTLAIPRTQNDPNVFAYLTSNRGIYQLDVRTGSPTFGQVIGIVTTTTNVDINGSNFPEPNHATLVAHSGYLLTDDFFKTVTITNTSEFQTAQSIAATDFILSGIDLNSTSTAVVDFTAVAGAPTVSSVSPSTITTDGGTITVQGTNFASGAMVRLGQNLPLSTTFLSSTQLQVTIPPGIPAQSAMDVVVTIPNTGADVSVQNLSGILRGAFSVELSASVPLASPLVSSMYSNGVTTINRKSQFNSIPQSPLHEVQGAGAVTADGGYIITPVSGDQINATTPVDGGIAITNLATGATTIKTSPVVGTVAQSMQLVSSINPNGGAPVMYLAATNDTYSDLVIETIDANPASGSFGSVLNTVHAGATAGSFPVQFGLAVTPDGRYVFAGGEDFNTGSSSYRVFVFDMLNQSVVGNFNPASLGAAQTQRLMTFAGGDLLMLMSNTGDIGAFDVTTTPGTAVLDGTMHGILPEGGVSLATNGFAFASNIVYVSGTATLSNGTLTPTLEAFNFDKLNSNYSPIGMYTASPATASGPVSVSGDGTQIYLTATNADQVQIFDQNMLLTNTPGALLASFGTPFGPAQFVTNTAASVPSTDLELAMTATPDPVAVGGTLTFNFTISNNGPLTATNVVLTDTLPAGTSITGTSSISCGGATCSCNNASPFVCSVSSIGVSSQVTGTFFVTAPPAPGDYSNSANVVADQAATTTGNAVTVGGTAVTGADVSVAISQPTNPVLINTPVTYTIVVSNAGQSDATNVSLLPRGGNNLTTPSSVTTTQGACAADASSCSLGTITAGASATVTVTAQSLYSGYFSVSASATADQADPNPANNTAYQTTLFVPSATAAARYIVPDRASGRIRQYAGGTNIEVPATNEPTAGYSVGMMALMPNGRIGFTAQVSNYVSVVDFSIGKEIARIPIRARTLALSRDGKYLLIVNALADELDVVDTSTLAVVNQISFNGLSGLGDDPNSADVNAAAMVVVGHKIYLNAAGTQFNTTTGFPVIVIDLNTNTASVIPGSAVGRGVGLPNSIAVTPDGSLVVALRVVAGLSLLIDTNTDTVLTTFSNFAAGPQAVAITADDLDPRGYFAYITNGAKTNVFDLRQGSATFGQFLVPGGVSGTAGNTGVSAALSPDGGRLYIAAAGILNTTAPQVDVFDTSALLSSPATAFLGGLHISDYVIRVFTGITDLSVPSGMPTISSVSPATIDYENATQITINGANFSSDAKVRIGRGDLITPDSVSPSQLLVTVPAQTPAGTQDVTVVDLNSVSSPEQQLEAAVAAGALTISPPVTFAPGFQVVGHDSGDGSVFKLERASAQTFVNQIALVPGAATPDGSTLWIPIAAGLLPYNYDTQSGTVVTGIPNSGNVGGIATGIDPVSSHAVVYLSTHSSGATGDPMLEIIDAASGSPTFGQVLRTINANLNDGSFAWSAAVTPDGRYVYSAPSTATTFNLVIYDVVNGTATTLARSSLGLGNSSVLDLRISPDGQRLIATDSTGAIAVLDVGTNPLAPARVGTLTPAIPAGFTSVSLNNYVITGNNFVFALDGVQNIAEVFNFNCGTNPCAAIGTYAMGGMAGDFPSGALAAPPDGSLIYALGFRSNVMTVLDPNLIVAANPNPVVAKIAAGVAPSGPAVTSRTVPNNDLSISLVAPASAGANGNYTYQITIHNGGATTAIGVTVLQQLPATFVSSSVSCSGTSNISCNVGSIAAGANAVFTVTALAPPSASGPLHTIATVSANESDSNLSNNTATGDTTLATACAPTTGYDKAWTGTVSSNWNDANNWTPGGVPTSTNNVFVCVGAPNEPALTAVAATQDLLLEAGATVATNGFTLTAAGSVNAGTSITGTGTLAMSGSGVTLQGTVPNLTVNGSVSLAGATTATGAAVVNGTLTVNGQTLDVPTLTVQGATNQASLVLTNASDAVNVTGNVLFQTQHESGNIAAGTLTVGGNFTLCCSGWAAYPGSGTNVVVLNGTGAQTITFASPNVALQGFQDLVINNPAGITLANNINVNGTVTLQSGALNGSAFTVTASNVTAAPGTTLNLSTLSVSGALSATGANYAVVNTVFTGAASQLIPQLAYQNVTVNGVALLTGATTATGNVTVNGTLTVNGQTLDSATLTVQGATSQASLVLTNPADAVNVSGNVLFNTQHESGNITAGTLTVGGSFTLCCSGWAAYPGSGTNSVVLNGTSAQTVSFASPNATLQAFQDVTINNAAGVNLASNIVVNGTLTLQSGSLTGASQTVTATNVSAASGTTLNLAALSISGTVSAAGANYNVASTTFTGSGGIPALPYQSLTIDGTSQLTAATTVTGPVLVNGSLTVNGQTLNAGSLTVQGPTSQASLVLTNPADAVNVSGNVLFETQHETGIVSAGTLTVGGNFTLCCGGWAAYPATGTNTVLLSGTSAQTVTFASPNATLQAFQEFVVNNSAGVNLASNIVTNDTLTLQAGTLAGGTASVTVPNVNAASGTTLNLGTLTFSGTVSATGANYVVASTIYTGNNPLPVLTYQALTLNGTTQLAGPTTASGAVTVNGSLSINGQTLNAGSLTVQGPTSQASITMTNPTDTVNVTGNTLFSTQAESGKITAGTLSAGGNFTLCCTLWSAYPASGTNTVVLNGTAAQTLTLASPSATQQAFENLVLNNSAGRVILASNVLVNGTLNSTTSVQTVSGTGQSLATAGVNVTQMVFNDALLAIGAGPITQFSNVVFQNMPTTATQLTVQNPGSSVPLVFDHIQFLTTPVSPGLYVSATDTLPTDGLPLIIDFQHNVPGNGSAFTSVANGATVNWQGNLAEVAMTGTTSSNVLLGNNETYTYTITNNGPDDAGTVTFTDAIPVNMTFVSADMGGNACTAPNNTITCTAASFASGASLTVNVVLHPTAPGSFTNVATVSGVSFDNNTANNMVSLNSTVTASADLSITETVTPTQTQPGGSLTYTITANNGGPSDATGVAITDTLPLGVTLQSVTPTQGTCTGTTSIACAIGTVTNGATVTVAVVVQVTGAGSLVNNVAVSANETDPVSTNNSASLTTSSIGADLVLSVNAPTGVLFGQDQPYTFTIFNNGPNDAGTTTFTDTIPANMSFVSADIGGAPCSVTAGLVTCTVASLAPSTSVNVNLVLHPTIAGTFINAASVQGSVTDTNTANNTVSVSSTIAPDADLRIAGSASPQQAQPGTNITYTITVQNFGPSDATGVVVSDNLSGLTSTVSATPTQGSCSGSAPVTCGLGTLTNGASATITIVAVVNTAGSLTNVATATANEVDTVPANNSVSIQSSSIAADLAISTAPAGSMNGEPAYSATVTNNGPSGATGVTFTANLVRYTFSGALPSSCTYVAPTLTCPIGSIAAGTSVTLTIAAQPPSSGWSEIDFAARGNEFDPNPTNNAARVAPPAGDFNTPSGSNVTVDTSDAGGSAAVTFGTVTLPGSTSISTLPLAANPPSGFRSGAAAVYYDVATTAQFTGIVGVTLRFVPSTFHHPTHVRLFHMENGAWVDRTTAINLAAGTASAVTASLSPFALFEPLDTPPVANAGTDITVNGAAATGTTVALDGANSGDADGDPLTYRWTGGFPEGGGTVTGVRPTITLPFGTSRVSLIVNDGELDSAAATVNVTVSDFLVAPANPSASVQAGTAATYSIAVSPKFGAFNAPVTLSCGNLPAGMSCSFAPSTITPGANGGTSTLTITTSKTSAAMSSPMRRRISPWLALTLAPFGFVLLGGIDRKRARWFVLALGLALLLLAVGCGGGSTVTPSPSSTSVSHPATTSTVTITATSAGVSHSTAVSITVQ